MNNILSYIFIVGGTWLLISCQPQPHTESEALPDPPTPHRVILDTDANNELDDQHAIAYMLFNPDYFEVEGITVNATFNGGAIDKHMEEARRIVSLCGKENEFPVIAGASQDYNEILPQLSEPNFDGQEAVDFIISEAMKPSDSPLWVVPIGTLTNVALAIAKAPEIIPRIKVMWLGANWPDPGEYNLVNDTTSVNPVLDAEGLDFQIATVRYGEPSGSAAVTATVSEIREKMAGLGPEVPPVAGRHGGEFTHFGDYAIDLFANIGDEERALFDVCALAVLKNSAWGEPLTVPAPHLVGQAWEERPNNPRQVIFWENFDKEKILADFYQTMERAE